MFSKIPQKLTSPFGILGDDAKLQFRTQPGGIRKLAEIRVCNNMWNLLILCSLLYIRRISIRQTHTGIRCAKPQRRFLNIQTLINLQYLTLFDTASDVFSLISPNDGSLSPNTLLKLN